MPYLNSILYLFFSFKSIMRSYNFNLGQLVDEFVFLSDVDVSKVVIALGITCLHWNLLPPPTSTVPLKVGG